MRGRALYTRLCDKAIAELSELKVDAASMREPCATLASALEIITSIPEASIGTQLKASAMAAQTLLNTAGRAPGHGGPSMSAMINGCAVAATTSQEIADLVESRHDSVKRIIERLANQEVITLPPLVEVSNPGPGRKFIAVHLFSGEKGKRDSIIVVAQLSPDFTARLLDRWQALEAGAAPPARVLSPAEMLLAQAQLMVEQQRRLEQYERRDTTKNSTPNPLEAFGDSHELADHLWRLKDEADLDGRYTDAYFPGECSVHIRGLHRVANELVWTSAQDGAKLR